MQIDFSCKKCDCATKQMQCIEINYCYDIWLRKANIVISIDKSNAFCSLIYGYGMIENSSYSDRRDAE